LNTQVSIDIPTFWLRLLRALGAGLFVAGAELLVASIALAAPAQPLPSQASPSLASQTELFLREQTRQQIGDVRFIYRLPDATQIPACTHFSFSVPQASRLLGRSRIEIRCPEVDPNWSLALPVQIQALASYPVTARALAAGHVVSADDLVARQGDLGLLPLDALTTPEQALGQLLRTPLGAGQALRAQQLKVQEVIRSGQQVRVLRQAPGFEVSNTGQALNNAGVGASVRVRLASGQILTGTASAAGEVRVAP
jgi:flagellar basal body P-ring formation protein FlgA